MIDADLDMARIYDLEIDTQFLPLSIYTLAVDYPDVRVQVTATSNIKNKQRTCVVLTKRVSLILQHPGTY